MISKLFPMSMVAFSVLLTPNIGLTKDLALPKDFTQTIKYSGEVKLGVLNYGGRQRYSGSGL